MAIQGMRFVEHQPPATIDVSEFYAALVEAHKKAQSVVVKPVKIPEPDRPTAPEYIRDREKARERQTVKSNHRYLTPEDLTGPYTEGMALGPVKLAGKYPELADPRTDFLLYDVGGSPRPEEIAEDTVKGFKEALAKISQILDNL